MEISYPMTVTPDIAMLFVARVVELLRDDARRSRHLKCLRNTEYVHPARDCALSILTELAGYRSKNPDADAIELSLEVMRYHYGNDS